MIAGILRGVMLRFASEYLSNVDVNKLSLWSGHIILQNVNLNVSALTNSLNLPYLRIESGQISKLELSIPWTSLSTRKVSVKIQKININLALTDNLVNLNKPPEVSASEETLLSKILANLSLEIEDLCIGISMSEESNYMARINLQTLKIHTTNHQWQQEFLNPFVTLTNGMAFRIYRKIECTGFSCRILAGRRREEWLSEAISSHKFEKDRCGGCPLCFGFKSSSYYTLAKISELNCTVMFYTSSEHTTSQGKYNHVQLFRCKDCIEAFVNLTSPMNLKLNLVADKVLARDVGTAIQKFEMPEIRPIGLIEAPSWFSWGKDMLFSPFYCSPASNHARITDKIHTKEMKTEVNAPSFMVKLRIHNLLELKTMKYVFSAESLCAENAICTSESSEGSMPRVFENKNTGKMNNLQVSCYEKNDCVIINVNTLVFNSNNNLFDYECKKISTKSIRKGHKATRDSIFLDKAAGGMVLGSEILIKLNADPIVVEIPLEDMNFLSSSILELKSFYFRLMNPQENQCTDSTLDFLLTDKKGLKQNEAKLVEELKEYCASLAGKLEQKNQECNLLRKTLCEVAGNSGIAGILNIDTSEIICVSEKAKIEGADVSLVLTKDLLYIVTKEGRILNKNSILDMIALEEKGNNELSIRLKEGKSIKSTLNNKNEFAEAIKEIFQSKN